MVSPKVDENIQHSFISLDMIRCAWIIRVHSEMTRTVLRSFLQKDFYGRNRVSFSQGTGRKLENGKGQNTLYYLLQNTNPSLHILRNKRDKGRNRNITKTEGKKIREYQWGYERKDKKKEKQSRIKDKKWM